MTTKSLIRIFVLGIFLLNGHPTVHAQETTPTEPSSAEQASPIQLEFLPRDTPAGLICRPNGFLTKSERDVVQNRVLSSISERFPFTIEEIDQVSFIAEDRPEGLLTGRSGLVFDLNIFHLSKAISWADVKEKKNIQATESIHENVTYERLEDSSIFTWPVDDRRMIVGGKDSIERAIDREAENQNRLHPLARTLPALGGSQMIFFIRADILFERLDIYKDDPSSIGVLARTMRAVADEADYVIVAVERADPHLVRVRFAVPCPDETLAKKKLRILAAVLAIFKRFMAQRQQERLDNADGLGDRQILANHVERIFDKSAIRQIGSTALISIEGDVAVGNVIGLFGNVFGSAIGQNFTGFSIAFDEAAKADRQEAEANKNDSDPETEKPAPPQGD